MFEDATEDLEEDDEAGDPEAGEEGVVDEVEHCDLQPGEGGSAIMEGFVKYERNFVFL